MRIRFTRINIFIALLIVIGLMSPNQWSRMPIGNLAVAWIVQICVLLLIPYIKKHYNRPYNYKDYLFVWLFLVWALAGSLRGVFVVENYWEYKQLVSGTMTCMLPAFSFVYVPYVTEKFYGSWLRMCIPLFFVFFVFMVTPGEVGFFLAPLYFIGCFMPLMPKKWRVVVFVLLAFMLVADLSARSQVLKALLAIVFSCACYYHRRISDKLLKIVHWMMYVGAIALLVSGLTGTFNVFEDMSSNKGKYVTQKVRDGEVVDEDLSADTRTFIYIEVLESALRHDYLWCGRTLARGNDSVAFGSQMGDELKTGKYERYSNELLHLNILTWLGLVGVLLYSLIYLRSSYMAVYHSRSIYLKLIGVFIAFHWAYGWVEDFNKFDIQNIALWSAIAMGLSSRFRHMSDNEFRTWFACIFGKSLRKPLRESSWGEVRSARR